jgi:hypothetical protein
LDKRNGADADGRDPPIDKKLPEKETAARRSVCVRAAEGRKIEAYMAPLAGAAAGFFLADFLDIFLVVLVFFAAVIFLGAAAAGAAVAGAAAAGGVVAGAASWANAGVMKANAETSDAAMSFFNMISPDH